MSSNIVLPAILCTSAITGALSVYTACHTHSTVHMALHQCAQQPLVVCTMHPWMCALHTTYCTLQTAPCALHTVLHIRHLSAPHTENLPALHKHTLHSHIVHSTWRSANANSTKSNGAGNLFTDMKDSSRGLC